MESTTNANQKEKFEGDLKKEIKKLQVITVHLASYLTSMNIYSRPCKRHAVFTIYSCRISAEL